MTSWYDIENTGNRKSRAACQLQTFFISSDEIFGKEFLEDEKNIECNIDENVEITLVTKDVRKIAMGKCTSITMCLLYSGYIYSY